MSLNIIAAIRGELEQQVDEKTQADYQRVFKEKVTCYGVKTSLVSKIAGRYFQEVKTLGKEKIFQLCEELLKSGYNEEAFIAFEWSYRLRNQYEKEDFFLFEDWLKKYLNNWAKCDTLCNHTIGAIIEKNPQFLVNLKHLAQSENRWLRRAAGGTLIIPAKQGKFLKDILKLSDILL